MNRGRLVAVVAGAAVLAAAVVMLRQDVQPPVSHAHRDAAVVNPPQRPGNRPRPPGRLHFDARRGGAVVSWPPAPYGFEVRWGRAGGQPRNLRYVATPAAGLRGLAPGKYHVEVRSVDEIGQRSEPSSADVEVSDREPSWLQGLGFIEDFASGAGLRADRWIMSDHAPGCVHREGGSGPILLDLGCD